MLNLIYWLRDKLTGQTLGAARSPKWATVRKEHLRQFPECAVCGKKGNVLSPNEAHHIKVFKHFPELELNPQNIITLCRKDHFSWGHFYNFKSWNENVREDATHWRERVSKRP